MRVPVACLCALAIGGGVVSASDQAKPAQKAKTEAHAAAPAPPAAKPAEPAAAAAHGTAAAHETAAPKAVSAKETSAPSHGAPDHGDVKPAVQKAAKGSAKQSGGKPNPVSPVELASRLQRILDEDAARRQNHGPAPVVAPQSAAARAKASPGRKPAPLLTWEAEPGGDGVTLSWDPEIDPRRPRRPLPTGVRLTWPEGRP